MSDDSPFRILELHRRLTEERVAVARLHAENRAIAKQNDCLRDENRELRAEKAVWQRDYNVALAEIEQLRKTIDYMRAERLRLRLRIVDDGPVADPLPFTEEASDDEPTE
jgi:FtsZ-binding cell division protein ZapB